MRFPRRTTALLAALALAVTACSPASQDDSADADEGGAVDDVGDTGDPDDTDDTDEPTASGELGTIELMTTTEGYDPIRYEAAFIIADAWEELGFEVEVLPTEFSTLIETFYDEQDFQVAISGWSGRVDRLDPQHFLGTLAGDNTDLGGNNAGGYVNDRYDELFALQRAEGDQDQRRDYVLELQEVAAEDMAVNVLFYRDEVVGYNNTTFENFTEMSGEALYNEWTPYSVSPLTDDVTLTIGTPEEPDTINPLDSTTVWGWKFMRMYYDKLVRLSPDAEPEGWAAESFEAIDDTTFEIDLRDGMTFHDGEPVTVEDIKFTYDYFIEQEFGYFMPFLQMIDNTEIVDDSTVRFNLETAFGPFPNVTMAQIPILPEHIWSDIDDPQDLAPGDIPTVGSGPMEFEQYDLGEYMSMTVFEDHWTAGDFEIDRMELIIYADAEGVFTGLQTGEIDMTAWRMEPGQIPLAEEDEDLTVVNAADFGYYHMTFNLREAPFDDPEVRKALSHAIDKNTIVDVLLDGRGEPGTSVVAPSNPFWHNPDVVDYPYDMDTARQMLSDAGY